MDFTQLVQTVFNIGIGLAIWIFEDAKMVKVYFVKDFVQLCAFLKFIYIGDEELPGLSSFPFEALAAGCSRGLSLALVGVGGISDGSVVGFFVHGFPFSQFSILPMETLTEDLFDPLGGGEIKAASDILVPMDRRGNEVLNVHCLQNDCWARFQRVMEEFPV